MQFYCVIQDLVRRGSRRPLVSLFRLITHAFCSIQMILLNTPSPASSSDEDNRDSTKEDCFDNGWKKYHKKNISKTLDGTNLIESSTRRRSFIPKSLQLIKMLTLSQRCTFSNRRLKIIIINYTPNDYIILPYLWPQCFILGNFGNFFHTSRHWESTFQSLIHRGYHNIRCEMSIFLLPSVSIQRYFFFQQSSHLTFRTWTSIWKKYQKLFQYLDPPRISLTINILFRDIISG